MQPTQIKRRIVTPTNISKIAEIEVITTRRELNYQEPAHGHCHKTGQKKTPANANTIPITARACKIAHTQEKSSKTTKHPNERMDDGCGRNRSLGKSYLVVAYGCR